MTLRETASVSSHPRVVPELDSLVALFYDTPERLGHFVEAAPDELPPVYRTLLAHNHHMTVAVEAHHGSPVDVRVLATRVADQLYARKILLTRQSDGRVVQFGIMRVNFSYLSDAIRREVESQSTPLGRILIRHHVLREVELHKLWQVTPGDDLAALFNCSRNDPTYGRTALIHCNGEPAVELLEIVTPETPDQ
jgi:chorismate-pyruvate lyase